MINIVLGAGFGDEGKGQAVHSLSHSDALVIRFSGGHQCGHTVVTSKGERHVFSQFGSGTFQDAPTYISQFCTVFPTAFQNEYNTLIEKKAKLPTYFVHPMAMVTTPYDLAFNRALSMITGHGTCGVGFGTTLQRNEDFFNLYALDLMTPYVYETKMESIEQYYEKKVKSLNMSSQIAYEQELEIAFEHWERDLDFYKQFIQITSLDELCDRFDDFVFEGSQGILLDQHFGFFPQVTRSNTTSQNAIQLISQNKYLSTQIVNTYYVSRCYLTRHGHGPFPLDKPILLKNNELETNVENDWQGVFKTAQLDVSLVEHAIRCDSAFNHKSAKRLIFTCYDQLVNPELFDNQLKISKFSQLVQTIELKSQADWSMES